MTERVTVEVGGFSSGKYYSTRLVKYDEDEEVVTEEAKALFKAKHGEPSGFGEYGTSIETQEMEAMDAGQAGHYKRVKKYIDVEGYMRGGKSVKGHRRKAWVRVWVPEREAVKYETELTHPIDKKRDTRGGVRRGRWK